MLKWCVCVLCVWCVLCVVCVCVCVKGVRFQNDNTSNFKISEVQNLQTANMQKCNDIELTK